MLGKLFALLQLPLPQHGLSRLMGKLAHSERPWLKNLMIRVFAAVYRVDLSEARESEPTSYRSFNEFFTRPLKPWVRPFPVEADAVSCPADGRLSQLGRIDEGRLLQAKGHDFSVLELLGGDLERAEHFFDGQFVTIYLAPRDYHRVHLPVAGTVTAMTLIPGRLFSVNPATAAQIPGLFARNERVVVHLDTEVGPCAVVLVGALVVASIEIAWHGVVTPPAAKTVHTWRYLQNPPRLARGDELGRFALGSTVIVLFPNDAVAWDATLGPDQRVRVGQVLGRLQGGGVLQSPDG